MENEYGPSPLANVRGFYDIWIKHSERVKEIFSIQKLPACPLSVIKGFDIEDNSAFSINLNAEQIEDILSKPFIEGDYVVVPTKEEIEERIANGENRLES